MTERSVRTWTALAGTAVLLGLCLWPRHLMPASEQSPKLVPHLDKVIHFGMFFGFTILWARAKPTPLSGNKWNLAVLGASAALAAATELAQGLPAVNRDPDVLDGLADLSGSFAAIGSFIALRLGSLPRSLGREGVLSSRGNTHDDRRDR